MRTNFITSIDRTRHAAGVPVCGAGRSCRAIQLNHLVSRRHWAWMPLHVRLMAEVPSVVYRIPEYAQIYIDDMSIGSMSLPVRKQVREMTVWRSPTTTVPHRTLGRVRKGRSALERRVTVRRGSHRARQADPTTTR